MKINSVRFDVAMANACITMSELSKKTNLNYSTLTRIKSGSCANPATVGKIAKALNVPVEELMDAATSCQSRKRTDSQLSNK